MKYRREDLINEIIRLRLEKGASTKWIIKDYLQDQIGYKQTYAYQLYREARARIKELYDEKAIELVNETLGQLEDLYQQSVSGRNLKLALEVRKEISKLIGLYASEKIDITSGGETLKNITFEIIEKKKSDDDLDEENK